MIDVAVEVLNKLYLFGCLSSALGMTVQPKPFLRHNCAPYRR